MHFYPRKNVISARKNHVRHSFDRFWCTVFSAILKKKIWEEIIDSSKDLTNCRKVVDPSVGKCADGRRGNFFQILLYTNRLDRSYSKIPLTAGEDKKILRANMSKKSHLKKWYTHIIFYRDCEHKFALRNFWCPLSAKWCFWAATGDIFVIEGCVLKIFLASAVCTFLYKRVGNSDNPSRNQLFGPGEKPQQNHDSDELCTSNLDKRDLRAGKCLYKKIY